MIRAKLHASIRVMVLGVLSAMGRVRVTLMDRGRVTLRVNDKLGLPRHLCGHKIPFTAGRALGWGTTHHH